MVVYYKYLNHYTPAMLQGNYISIKSGSVALLIIMFSLSCEYPSIISCTMFSLTQEQIKMIHQFTQQNLQVFGGTWRQLLKQNKSNIYVSQELNLTWCVCHWETSFFPLFILDNCSWQVSHSVWICTVCFCLKRLWFKINCGAEPECPVIKMKRFLYCWVFGFILFFPPQIHVHVYSISFGVFFLFLY